MFTTGILSEVSKACESSHQIFHEKKITISINQLLLMPADDGIGRCSSISLLLTVSGRIGWQVPKLLVFFCCFV